MNETSEAAAEAATSVLLLDAAFMLGAALVFVTLFRRLGLGATLGYIVGGAFIGPYALGLISEPESVMRVSEFGIALLLFLVGLELNPSRLWRLRRDIFGLGLVQVILCGLAISLLIHLALGFSPEASLAIGLPLGLSSTAQVLPMLRSSGELNTESGEKGFSILLFQDLSLVPLITVIAAMSRAPADPSSPSGLMLAIYTVVAVIGLVIAGRLILNPLFRLVGRLGERELFVVAGLFAVVGSAALMHQLHLSVPLGAFVAGVMLAESPYRHELESDVEPFRSILLGMFFLSVGMLLDLSAIASRPLLVVGLAVAVIVVKTLVITGLARLFGVRGWRAIWLGLLLSQAGEFGFVLFGQAAAAQLVLPEAASLFSAVVTVSMITTPFLMWILERMEHRMSSDGPEPEGPGTSPVSRAIVVGYGRFGQTVAQMLMAKKIGVTIVDTKAQQIELSEEFGTKVYYGDGTRIDLLRTAGGEQAEAIIFCHDAPVPRDVVEGVMKTFPDAKVMMRVFDRRQLIDYAGVDVAFLQRELFESAVVMGREALKILGVPGSEVDRVERVYRSLDSERLEKQSETGDIRAAKDRMFAAGRSLPDEEGLEPG